MSRAQSRCAAAVEQIGGGPALRIGLIGSARHGAEEPYAGGMEAMVAALATHLRRRGHEVSVHPRTDQRFTPSDTSRRDVSSVPDHMIAEHHAHLDALLAIQDSDIDLVHNHSLHHLPVAMASMLGRPMVTTLHSPPTPWLESALAVSAGRTMGPLVSVSQANADQWQPTVRNCAVIRNGVDLTRFRPGEGGGGYAAWFGRLVPEKGVVSAVAAAHQAGVPIRIAGPVHDPEYFDVEVRPHLSRDVTYEGHLDVDGLNELVGSADVTLVTPHWDEPYGLVVAESLAMGTPVVAFSRGGIPEVVSPECARLVSSGDVDALARSITSAAQLDRGACRRRAEDQCDIERMVDDYVALYRSCLEDEA